MRLLIISPVIWMITLRGLLARWNRTLLTLLGIVLGVAVVLATQITNQTTLDSLRQVFDRTTGKANLIVIPSSQDGKELSEDIATLVAKVRGVEAVAPTVLVRTLTTDQAENWQIAFQMGGIASGNMFLLYGIDPQQDPVLRVYELAEGRMPGDNKHEVIIPKSYADEKKLKLGDTLELLTPQDSARLKIIGLLQNEGVAMLNNGVVGFTSLPVVQDLYDRQNQFDEIAIKTSIDISEDPRALEYLKSDITKRVGKRADIVYPGGRGQLVSQMLATYQLGLSFFSLIAIFVGAFLIYNTFSMTVAERTREIGMLRAIGMSRRHILRSVMFEAGLLSLVGSTLGILLGLALARGLIRLIGGVITTEQDVFALTPWAVVQSLAVGVGVTLIAAFLPARQAAKISPLEALRVQSRSHERIPAWIWMAGLGLMLVGYLTIYQLIWPEQVIFPVGSTAIFFILLGGTLTVPLAVNGVEWLARPVVARLYGNEGAVGSANVRRSISRTTLTVASLMVALTMIISIGSVAHSFQKDMGSWIDSALGGDLYVRSGVPLRESFARNLKAIPGVEVVTPTRTISVRAPQSTLPEGVTKETFYFNAIDPFTYRQVADMEFIAHQGDPEINWKLLERGGAIFVSNVTAARYDLHQGDTFTLLTRRGEREFLVAGVVMDFTGQSGVIYGSYEDLRSLFSEQGVDRFTIKVADGYSIRQVAQEIEDRYQKRRRISVQTTQEFKDSILNIVDQSFRLFDVLSLIGVLIGGMGVVNTLTMNVIERQREIGALRSLGMNRRQVIRMVLAESLAMGIMGGGYGLLFGYIMAEVMIFGMNIMIGYDLAYRFTPTPYTTGVLIAFLVSQVAAYFPARRAARVNIVAAVKHE